MTASAGPGGGAASGATRPSAWHVCSSVSASSREVVGDLLHRELAFHVAHQGAEHLGVVRVAQRVEQRLLVAHLAGALPGGVAVGQLAR
jgi:hypothetical protein